ncbi:MAG TPA: hypothetical protein VKQ05_02425 [Gemmatimonadales bacterium]|nr:hypothetical protein [Gemmatimonadales bacterium]
MWHVVLPFVEGVVTFLVVAATAMSGVSLWLRYRAQNPPGADTAALDGLRDENAELRGRMAELEERLDFVERRTIQDQQPARLPPAPRPERTPV